MKCAFMYYMIACAVSPVNYPPESPKGVNGIEQPKHKEQNGRI